MATNGLQFGVVREDARVERALVERFDVRRALLVGSGGCTGISLAHWFPELELELVDPNPAQLRHAAAKRAAVEAGADLAALGVLAEAGNFEALFRMFRGVVYDLVLGAEAWEAFFAGDDSDIVAGARRSPYWSVAFELAFSDALLRTMFGNAALQHAQPGSYPAYFQQQLEGGLRRHDARRNPFLHHIFLGRYVESAPPDWASSLAADTTPWKLRECRVESAELGGFGLIGLSNIFDWMAPHEVAALMRKLRVELDHGAVIVWRQLNNARPLHELLGGDFEVDHELGESLRALDRSLFYRRIHVARRV